MAVPGPIKWVGGENLKIILYNLWDTIADLDSWVLTDLSWVGVQVCPASAEKSTVLCWGGVWQKESMYF